MVVVVLTKILQLREYDWGQVSVYRYPNWVVNPNNCSTVGPTKDKCRMYTFNTQKSHGLQVKTLQTILQELNHTYQFTN